MGKVKINKRTGKAVRPTGNKATEGANYNQYAGSSRRIGQNETSNNQRGTFGRYSDYMRNSINSTGVNSPLKRATMYNDRAVSQARRTMEAGQNRYAGSSRRIDTEQEPTTERSSLLGRTASYPSRAKAKAVETDNVGQNRYAGSSRRIGQQEERKSKDYNWNQYAGSSRRIGQESGQPAKASLKDTSAPAKQKATTYTIKKGDTLGSIAKRYGVDWRALAEANGIDDPNLVYAGVKLKINPATMGKRSKRKIGIDLSRTGNKRKNNNGAPDWKVGEREINIPTAEEAGYPVNVDYPSLRMLP